MIYTLRRNWMGLVDTQDQITLPDMPGGIEIMQDRRETAPVTPPIRRRVATPRGAALHGEAKRKSAMFMAALRSELEGGDEWT